MTSDSDLQWLTFWRGDFTPSVSDTSPRPGYRLATRIFPHLLGSEYVPPYNQVHKKMCSIKFSVAMFILLFYDTMQ